MENVLSRIDNNYKILKFSGTRADFATLMNNNPGILIFKFTADWCGPCKNIKETDKKLKEKLKKFNVKREIYKADSIDDLRNAIKEVQKESDSLELEIVPESKECDVIGCNYCNIYFTNKYFYKRKEINIE
jgi:thiol-disulfide isomerase/thioredoxin